MESLRLRLYEWSVHWDCPYCFLWVLFGTACFILCLLPPTRCPGSTPYAKAASDEWKTTFPGSERPAASRQIHVRECYRWIHASIHPFNKGCSMDPIICQRRLINLPPRRLTAERVIQPLKQSATHGRKSNGSISSIVSLVKVLWTQIFRLRTR